jgi:hypothetical protein
MNKKHLKNLIENWTIESLSYDTNDLLIFIDDTGDEKLSKGQPVFGLGGCACRSADYDTLKITWTKLRREVFGLADEEEFHASALLRNLSAEKLTAVTEFLALPYWYRLSYVVDQNSNIPAYIGNLSSVIAGIRSLANELFYNETPTSVHWIIEHSDRLCPVMLENGV